uniref:Uncharacterized protein n=1 Tax=Oryza punctata TaxID=4537 RepID=A0A0G2KBQ4_ORYPU
MLMMCLKV